MDEEKRCIYTTYSISDYPIEGAIVLNENKDGSCNGIVRFRKNDNCHIEIYEVLIEEEYKHAIDAVSKKPCIDCLIKAAFEDIIENGKIPAPTCLEAREWYQKEKEKMGRKDSIMEIESNSADGSKKMNKEDDSGYDLFIEYPVRAACKALNEKKIVTIMSSANKEDAARANEPEKTKDPLFIGPNQHFSIGNGYAWIMIDYSKLTQESKEIIDSLNSGEMEVEMPPAAKQRLNHNCQINNVPTTQSEMFKYYRVVSGEVYSEELRKKQRRPRISEQEESYFIAHSSILTHRNSLSYHGSDYQAVVLRYPIDQNTSIEEIVDYFNNIVSILKDNTRIKIIIH